MCHLNRYIHVGLCRRKSHILYDATIVATTIIIGIIFVQEGTRRIPIVSARQLGKGQSQNKTSYLPLRLNQGGVMPIIFASAVLVLPAYLPELATSNPEPPIKFDFDNDAILLFI